jgi:hypothetical protein
VAALGDVLLVDGGADCGSDDAVWLAALLLMSLLCAEVDGEVDDAGAFGFMLFAEDAVVESLVCDDVLGVDAAGVELAALVSLLVEGLAAVLAALSEVFADEVSLGLLIDDVGPGLLPAPQ